LQNHEHHHGPNHESAHAQQHLAALGPLSVLTGGLGGCLRRRAFTGGGCLGCLRRLPYLCLGQLVEASDPRLSSLVARRHGEGCLPGPAGRLELPTLRLDLAEQDQQARPGLLVLLGGGPIEDTRGTVEVAVARKLQARVVRESSLVAKMDQRGQILATVRADGGARRQWHAADGAGDG
jgi:hypothetical protein